MTNAEALRSPERDRPAISFVPAVSAAMQLAGEIVLDAISETAPDDLLVTAVYRAMECARLAETDPLGA